MLIYSYINPKGSASNEINIFKKKAFIDINSTEPLFFPCVDINRNFQKKNLLRVWSDPACHWVPSCSIRALFMTFLMKLNEENSQITLSIEWRKIDKQGPYWRAVTLYMCQIRQQVFERGRSFWMTCDTILCAGLDFQDIWYFRHSTLLIWLWI